MGGRGGGVPGPRGGHDLHGLAAGAADRAADDGTDGLRTRAKLISSGLVPLDGYLADRDGRFDWAEPDEEVHTFVNNQERGGRRRFAGGMVHLRYRTVGTSP
jgi:hypothetical protein